MVPLGPLRGGSPRRQAPVLPLHPTGWVRGVEGGRGERAGTWLLEARLSMGRLQLIISALTATPSPPVLLRLSKGSPSLKTLGSRPLQKLSLRREKAILEAGCLAIIWVTVCFSCLSWGHGSFGHGSCPHAPPASPSGSASPGHHRGGWAGRTPSFSLLVGARNL